MSDNPDQPPNLSPHQFGLRALFAATLFAAVWSLAVNWAGFTTVAISLALIGVGLFFLGERLRLNWLMVVGLLWILIWPIGILPLCFWFAH